MVLWLLYIYVLSQPLLTYGTRWVPLHVKQFRDQELILGSLQ